MDALWEEQNEKIFSFQKRKTLLDFGYNIGRGGIVMAVVNYKRKEKRPTLSGGAWGLTQFLFPVPQGKNAVETEGAEGLTVGLFKRHFGIQTAQLLGAIAINGLNIHVPVVLDKGAGNFVPVGKGIRESAIHANLNVSLRLLAFAVDVTHAQNRGSALFHATNHGTILGNAHSVLHGLNGREEFPSVRLLYHGG
jgi:hypothetical protein